tara:strand:+ start:987 stop:1283 length:297 start_codon:yes stop_codon:yes gene_type:complete
MKIKIHQSRRNVVAIADSDLLGKTFEEGKRQLDLTTQFYQGSEFTHDQAVELIEKQMQEDSSFNIVGQKSVEAAIQAGLISSENVSTVQQIPFALTLL